MNSVEQAKEWLQQHFPEKTFQNLDQETLDRKKETRKVLNKAAELAQGELKNNHTELYEFIKKDRNFTDQVMKEAMIGFMSRDVIQTLNSRFDKQALLDSGLFYENEGDLICQMYRRIIFPYMRGDQTWYMIGRKPHDYKGPEKYQEILSESDAKYKKLIEKDTYNKHIVYEWHQDSENTDTVIVTEGVTDAISAHAAGYNVSSPVTTKYSDEDIEKVCNRVRNFDNVYIIMDGDDEGWKGALKTGQEMAEQGVEAALVNLEEGDLDDYTERNGYEIEELLDDAEYYLDILFEEIGDASRRDIGEKKRKLWRAIRGWDQEQRSQVFAEMPGSKREAKKEFTKWLDDWEDEQAAKNSQIENSVDDGKDQTDDETKITKKLKVKNPGEVIHINPRQRLIVNQIKETATETKVNKVGTVEKTPQFKVYEVQFGEGEDTDTFNLLVEPWRNLSLGETDLPVKRADLLKDKYRESEYFKDKYKQVKEEVEGFSLSYDEWLRKTQNREYLELQGEIDSRGREVVSDLDNETILEMVREYLQAGWYTDPKLRTVMYSKIIQHKKSEIKPGNVSKYQPHTQMWTNTKVGKSKTAGRVGKKIDDATPAGLLGYADSDGKQQGTIDGVDRPVFIDEFNFGASSRQLNDQLLSLMEEGYFEQNKAGHSVKTRFYGSLSYLANPKDADLPEHMQDKDKIFNEYSDQDRSKFELVTQFEELIQFLGMNIQAMASRFGVVVFDESMDTAEAYEDVDLSNERFEKLEMFVEWIRFEVSKRYTEIERQLRDWLEKEYEEDYKDRIKELASETHNDRVEKFWKNHVHSYRHARGQALRMAVFQNIGDIVNDDYNIDDLRQEAENQWKKVKEINRESLENMTEATDDEQEISRARSKLDNYSPKYLRLFAKAVINHHQKDNEVGKRKVFDELKSDYSELKTELPDDDVSENSRYWKWNKLRNQVSDKLNEKRLNLEQDFGIELVKFDGEEMFRISKPERFKTFMELDIGAYSEKESEKVEDESNEFDEEYKVSGDYSVKLSGVFYLIKDNHEEYVCGGVPEKHILRYVSKNYSPSGLSRAKDNISDLASNGRIRESNVDGVTVWKPQ